MPSPVDAAPGPSGGSQWHARLKLRYRLRPDRTALVEREHAGPLTVQKPFYPGDGACHTYILHPPGGMAPGDRLNVDITADDGASVLLTTPAAGKCYRSDGRLTTLTQTLRAGNGACLEWLPQENIFFEGCNAELTTRVELVAGAKFIGWETVCLGRPAAGEAFEKGIVKQRFELWRGDQPLLIERTVFKGGDESLGAPWGLNGNTVLGTLVAVGVDSTFLEKIKHNNATAPASELSAATLIDDVLVCRHLGTNIESARQYFMAVWQQVRPLLLNRPAVAPRIWST